MHTDKGSTNGSQGRAFSRAPVKFTLMIIVLMLVSSACVWATASEIRDDLETQYPNIEITRHRHAKGDADYIIFWENDCKYKQAIDWDRDLLTHILPWHSRKRVMIQKPDSPGIYMHDCRNSDDVHEMPEDEYYKGIPEVTGREFSLAERQELVRVNSAELEERFDIEVDEYRISEVIDRRDQVFYWEDDCRYESRVVYNQDTGAPVLVDDTKVSVLVDKPDRPGIKIPLCRNQDQATKANGG